MTTKGLTQKLENGLITTKRIFDGSQRIYRFNNNYGASVIYHSGSIGLELAVIRFNSDNDNDWELCYDTRITNDVIGYNTWEDIYNLLKRIKRLKFRFYE